MKAVTLFAVLLSLVSAAPHPKTPLDEIFQDLQTNLLHLPEKLALKLVPHVMDGKKCEPQDFCLAEKILEDVQHKFKTLTKDWTIVKYLKRHNEQKNCTINPGNEYELKQLITDLKTCFQKKYSKVSH